MNTRVTRNVLVSILAVALITGCGKKQDKIAFVNEDMTESERLQAEEVYSEKLDLYYYDLKNASESDTNRNIEYNNSSMVEYVKEKDNNGKFLDDVGYGFIDINGDGIKELIIGDNSDNWKFDNMIFSICILKNNLPRCITGINYDTKEGEDSDIPEVFSYLCDGNKIISEKHSRGGENYSYELYQEKISENENGSYKDIVGGVKVIKLARGDKRYKSIDENGNETDISENEANKIIEEYKSSIVQPMLTPFSEYTPRTEEGRILQEKAQDEGMVLGKGFSSWQEGYKTCLDEVDGDSYALIYLDDDDVPELFIDAFGDHAMIYSYYEGKVVELSTANFSYVEKSGLLCSDGGLQGLYHDNVYSLSKGRWNQIFEGMYYDRECNGEPVGDNKYRYFIGDKEVDEDTYRAKLDEVYGHDEKIYIDPEDEFSYEELMEKLK
ncbi:MAG: hypothetical protein J5802_04805 [Butyrivibrio sp.]|nr:hypothetical protein [Butyrivibrio sp.]